MRIEMKLDHETIMMFGLNSEEISHGNELLSLLGLISPDSLAKKALGCPEKSTHAAIYRALRAPYPWAWQAAELDDCLAIAAENFEGCKLFCALIAHSEKEGSLEGTLKTPSSMMEDIKKLGAIPCPFLIPAHVVSSWSHHQTKSFAQQLYEGKIPDFKKEIKSGALSAWALPILYKTTKYGAYEDLDNISRGLLTQSLADAISNAYGKKENEKEITDVLMGLGSFRDLMNQAQSLCAPINLRAKVNNLCESVRIKPEDLAVSVSFHEGEMGFFMRIGIRPNDTGFCLSGLDWPTLDFMDDQEFDRLLTTLTNIGIEWCYQVEGEYDDLLCPKCLEPIYPNPVHKDWKKAALDAGAPPDGSHTH